MMLTPQKAASVVASPRTAVPLNKGLFADGIWKCNCRDRPPAAKFQTKNHGKNHGRWFYTCQKRQSDKCNFWLWADDAEIREKITLLSNSRSESDHTQTPSKTPQGSGLLTPRTTDRRILDIPSLKPNTPSMEAKAKMMSEDMEKFEWDDEMDDEVNQILDRSSQPSQPALSQPDFGRETPRKAARTTNITSPGKQKLGETEIEETSASQTLTPQSPYKFSFLSQSSQNGPQSAGSVTPSPSKHTSLSSPSPSSRMDPAPLSRQVVSLLASHRVVLPQKAQDELGALLDRHDLRHQGIARGRDISRISLRKKDEQIMKLNQRIQSLESQREMDRAVIDGLRNPRV